VCALIAMQNSLNWTTVSYIVLLPTSCHDYATTGEKNISIGPQFHTQLLSTSCHDYATTGKKYLSQFIY